MSVIHRTTMSPAKLELITGWLPGTPWYGERSTPRLAKAGGFRLDDPDGEVGIEFVVACDTSGRRPAYYHVPLTYRSAPLPGADDALIGTAEHGVLGTRWVYDGCADPVLVGQLCALYLGRAQPQLQNVSDTPDPSVHTEFRGAADLIVGPPKDYLHGTDIIVDTESHGELAITVVRALTPGADAAALGSVTAPWQSVAGTTRGVFATLRSHHEE